MFKDKRGISNIIVTLIMIILVLAALMIIWFVVRGLIDTGSEQITRGTECLNINLEATELENIAGTTSYALTLSRGAGGPETIGAKIVFFNDTANSGVVDFPDTLEELETKRSSANLDAGISSADKVEVTATFIDASGSENICPGTNTYTFG